MTDIEIAQKNKMTQISQVAKKIGIEENSLGSCRPWMDSTALRRAV